MSFSELLALREQVNAALWASDDWQSVTVPAGIYVIGREIPAGRWTIRPVDGHTANISIGDTLDASKTALDYMGVYGFEQITSPSASYSQYNTIESVSWDLTDGYYLAIDNASVIFEPYIGPSFSFN